LQCYELKDPVYREELTSDMLILLCTFYASTGSCHVRAGVGLLFYTFASYRCRIALRNISVCISPPLESSPSEDELNDTARMSREVAKLNRPDPEKYFWTPKRFKARSPEENQ